VFSEFGCIDTISQNIIINPNPTADFSMSNQFTQVLDPVFFTDQSIDASVWYWDFGDGIGFSTDQSPNYAYGNFGQYSIELIIENQFGCTDTAIQTITVKQPPLLPLAFSPNNDGLNDYFNVLGGYFIEFQFIIYNNWGKQIYISQDPELGWDGTYNNEEQPIGVYVYLLKVVTEDGQEYNLHGDVTLIR
jgi:gliding motility-associated-like protein